MTRRLLQLFALSFALSPLASANVAMPLEGRTHLNVGVRLAWNTESGVPVWGFEASYTFQGELTHGPVLGLDFPPRGPRLGLGYEVVLVPPTLGLESGPTIAITNGTLEAGWHVTGFIGGLVFIHDQMTWLPSGGSNELGFMLKAPIPVLEVDRSGSPD